MLSFVLRRNLSSSRFTCAQLHHAVQSMLVKDTTAMKIPEAKIDLETIRQLERLSLVDFANVTGIDRLESAINLADRIRNVNTDGVEPLYSVLEDESLYLREDVAVKPVNRDALMSLAVRTEEDYYSAPQGNISLEPTPGYPRESDQSS